MNDIERYNLLFTKEKISRVEQIPGMNPALKEISRAEADAGKTGYTLGRLPKYGEIEVYCEHKDGDWHGLWAWLEDSIISEYCQYKNGKKNGICYEIYEPYPDTTPYKAKQFEYQNGIMRRGTFWECGTKEVMRDDLYNEKGEHIKDLKPWDEETIKQVARIIASMHKKK